MEAYGQDDVKMAEEKKATFPNYTRARAINVVDGNFRIFHSSACNVDRMKPSSDPAW